MKNFSWLLSFALLGGSAFAEEPAWPSWSTLDEEKKAVAKPDSALEEDEEESEVQPERFEARVTGLKGEVYIFPIDDASDSGYPAEINSPIERGDRIETRARSSVEIALEEDSVMELGSNTVFTVDALEKEESVFALSLGSMVAKFKLFVRRHRGYRILTPTAVAAVRGTEFGLEVREDGRTTIGVYDEGEVGVTTTDGSVEETLLRPQEEVVVRTGKLDIEEKDGRRMLRRRKLKTLKRRHKRIKYLRARRAHLRKAWKAQSRTRRKEIRRRMVRKHRERLKNMSAGKRRKMISRMKRRTVKHKINRRMHRKMRERLRERGGKRRGENMRRRGRERRQGKRERLRRGAEKIRQKVRQERRQKGRKKMRQKMRRRQQQRRRGGNRGGGERRR